MSTHTCDDNVSLVVEWTTEYLVSVALQHLRYNQASHITHKHKHTCTHSPLATSHTLAVRSLLAVSSRVPWGLNVTLEISPLCPTILATHLRVAVSYTRAVPATILVQWNSSTRKQSTSLDGISKRYKNASFNYKSAQSWLELWALNVSYHFGKITKAYPNSFPSTPRTTKI